MPLYETVFITRQDVPAQEAEALVERLGGIVAEHGGSVVRSEYWGLRTLAYRIKKNRKGHYAMLHIDAPADAVSEMERNMRLHENVLRYLTVRTDAFDENPSAIMQGRTIREGRSRRETDRRSSDSGDESKTRVSKDPPATEEIKPVVAAKAEDATKAEGAAGSLDDEAIDKNSDEATQEKVE